MGLYVEGKERGREYKFRLGCVTFVEIDLEIISTVIYPRFMKNSCQLLANVCRTYANRLKD